MSERDPHRWARFAASAGALVVLVVLVPLGLIAASRSRFGSANPLAGADAPWSWGSGDVGDALSGPLADDTVIDGIIRLSLWVIWIALVVIVVTTLVEVVHSLRHRGIGLPDVRGIGWAQSVARFIAIGLIAVVPTITPSTSLASSLGSRSAASSSIDVPSVAPSPNRGASQTAVADAPTMPSEVPGFVHVVTAGESIYSIAVDLAGGDRARVLEIADAIIDANLGSSMPGGQRFTNPAYIEMGWTLRLPAGVAHEQRTGNSTPAPNEPTATSETTYTVERGDTLWDIADEQLGDPAAWPDIWERNAGADMGGGRTFDDPNLILPGWELDLADTPAGSDPSITPPAVGGPDEAPTAPPGQAGTDGPGTETGETDTDQTTSAPTDSAIDDWGPDSPVPGIDDPWQSGDDAAAGPLPLGPTPTASTTSTSTSTTVAASAGSIGAGDVVPTGRAPAPDTPSPIRLEHAALVAAGVLALVGVRRRRRLRAAMPRHRVPEPRADVARTERKLRTIDAGERLMRADVACRAAARSLVDTGSQIGWMQVSHDGDLDLRLTAPATLPPPWVGDEQAWKLGADVPVEMLGDDARHVGQPCVAFVQLGVTPIGEDVLVDLEACGVLAVQAPAAEADEVVTALATALASSQFAEVAHLVAVSLPETALLGHRNAHLAESADAALDLACSLAGSTAINDRSSFELRSLRTGGEMWEPAVALLASADDGVEGCLDSQIPDAGHGVAIVVADELGRADTAPATLAAGTQGWHFDAFGTSIQLTPLGVSAADLGEITELIADADRDLDPVDALCWADSADEPRHDDTDSLGDHESEVALPVNDAAPFEPRPHEIVVGLMGGVEVHARTGETGNFERSKTVELIAWLTTHRDRSTRSGARTALWDLDVRDATFANVVSEARRALARLVVPPEGEEWVARTLTEQLPVHDLVVTDADLVEERLAHARLQPPAQALETLRPAVELVRDMPFAGTSYLWPDAEGITSNLVLLAITATAEFAGHALSLGDTDGVFWSTGKGLRVLSGHEELIALRMQAHARVGDLAGVRQEWESYERVLVADAWSDGEPAPKLLALRRELLSPSSP